MPDPEPSHLIFTLSIALNPPPRGQAEAQSFLFARGKLRELKEVGPPLPTLGYPLKSRVTFAGPPLNMWPASE